MSDITYSQVMREQPSHLILKLDTDQPILLSDFVGAFTSLSNEYERYIKETNPDLLPNSEIFVKEVRAGCIEAELLPWLAVAAPIITEMDKALIVEQFVRSWGGKLKALISGNRGKQPKSKAELKDFTNAVTAISIDPNGSATLSAAVFEDGKREIKVAFKFDNKDAKKILKSIDALKDDLDKIENADHDRVLMVFTRSDVHNAKVGRSSGERVVIEEISPKSLGLMYASNLAEKRIKHEIREADENVFKKGFEVDVNVKLSNGKPVAYSVTNVHQVFDLPSDD